MTSPSLGSTSRVNTYVSGNQQNPAIGTNVFGNTAIVWDSDLQDGDGDGVFGRLYTASGNPTAGEFRVNTTTTGDQNNPSVAVSSSSFVVVWTSNSQDGSGSGIYAQRYSTQGAPIGAEFRANQVTEDEQTNPDVAMDASGNFVVVFESQGASPNTIGQDTSETGIFGQRFNSAGAPVGLQFRVNSITQNAQTAPAIAMSSRGQFVVAWTSAGQDGDGLGVFAQRYDAFGNPVGIELQVNTETQGDQLNPSVAMDNAGNFVVAWQSERGSSDIYAQRFSASGSPLGDEFRVNDTTGGDQTAPSVDTDANGNFTVAWASENGIFGQRFDRNGRSNGNEFQLSGSSTDSDDTRTGIAVTPIGDFVVAWQEGTTDNQDVFARGTTSGKTIRGTSGPDNLQGTSRNDNISGLKGADTIRGLGGNDTLNGNAGNDVLAGQEGDDILLGASNADTLDGGVGNDTLTGGSGGDVFVLQTKQGSTLITDFEDGTDRLGLAAELSPTKLRFEQAGSDAIVIWNGIELATLSNINADRLSTSDFVVASSVGLVINGDRNDNRLSGTSGSDEISGLQGNDQLLGRGGDDTLLGGSGDDTLTGDNGLDSLIGGNGNDRLNGGQGDDFLEAGNGKDTVTGGSGVDIFFLTLKNGTTTITDFQNGVDFLQLSEELDPSQVRAEQRGANTAILLDDTLLAILKNTNASSITNTVSDFL